MLTDHTAQLPAVLPFPRYQPVQYPFGHLDLLPVTSDMGKLDIAWPDLHLAAGVVRYDMGRCCRIIRRC